MSDPANIVSLGILAALAAALAVWGLIAWRRTRYGFVQSWLYLINVLITRVLWRAHVSGPLPVPPGQGAVVVCNHRSGIDPLLTQLTTNRVIHWMVAREYAEHPVMAWAFRILQVIPTNRGGIDTAATRTAIRLAREGGLVGMFPEGRINETGRLLLPGRPGAALVALKARVPVVPMYVQDSPYDKTSLGPLIMPAKARVVVGQPLDLSRYYGRKKDREVLQELTKLFLREIAKLAGVADFEPELAGKRWKPDEEEPG